MYMDVLYSTAISLYDILTALGCNSMILPLSVQYVLQNSVCINQHYNALL